MSANNSISQLLEQFLELNTNSLETFNQINEAITTDKETVTLDLFDTDTQTKRSVQIPSFGYLKQEVDRLNNNVKQISAVDGNDANIRLKDGTFRKIHTTNLKGPAKNITTLAAPNSFNIKLNEFFEDFLNPLLTINLDVSNQIPVETKKVYIEKFIIDNNDLNSVELFDEIYKGENEIDYLDFKNELINQNLKYFVDSEIINMPVNNIQYTGNFDVTNISNEQKTNIIDGVTRNKTIQLFTLNKLTYNNTKKDQLDTEVLKVNDSLIVNSGAYKTRYLIRSIDASTSQVELELIEGYEAINIGAAELSIYKDIDTDLHVEINIGFNERQIVFIKALDPESNILAERFSPGIGFYSNELNLQKNDGAKITLAEYYKNEVADFGEFIKSLKVDYIPPSNIGLTPNIPTLNTQNFKVVQVNKHLTENNTTKKIKQLKADKTSVEQNLKKLDASIRQKKSELNTRKFESQIEKDKQKNELNSIISEREDESKLYNSIVNDIKSSAEEANVAKVTPKFRLRGFWSVPQPRAIANNISQEVIQFKIQYRYVSTSGKTSEINQIKFKDQETEKTAAFSNWIEVKSPIRKRGKNDNGVYKWMFSNEEDAQEINFNSLDIAINSGEIVEFRIKSISEAGFPANPIESDWSEISRFEFPQEELTTESILDVVKSNEVDKLKVDLEESLRSNNVYQHVDTSFTVNDKFYAHSANDIASGFLADNQSPISIYDKLIQLQQEILRLQGEVKAEVGELNVRIIDDNGNVTPIKNNTVNKIFAGYYIDELPETDYKGFIVTKNFKIELSNTKANKLELIARISGDRKKAAYTSTVDDVFGLGNGNIDPKVINDTYYTNQAKYDLVPVVYQNLENDAFNNFIIENPNQSSQLRGQYIYSRFTNLANDNNFYVTEDIDTAKQGGYTKYEYGLSYIKVDADDISTTNDKDFSNISLSDLNVGFETVDNNGINFIWDGKIHPDGQHKVTSLEKVSNNTYDSGILMHIDHPLINDKNSLEMQSNGYIGMPKTANKHANQTNGKQQTAFKLINSINNNGNEGMRKSIKNSFDASDQYLLGGKSCGSFLYMSPIDTEELIVDADNKEGKKEILSGDKNAITLNMIFQYRMTDYYGFGTTGTGRIGGLINSTLSNLTYAKKIGFDILDMQNNEFKFDVEVFAKYRATGSNINSIGASLLTNYNTFNGNPN